MILPLCSQANCPSKNLVGDWIVDLLNVLKGKNPSFREISLLPLTQQLLTWGPIDRFPSSNLVGGGGGGGEKLLLYGHRNLTEILVFINPLNAKLNPICHLLVLLGAHHILHVSRIRVK